MIDIHSHIINEIDDGSKNLEMTIAMLKKAQLTGTKSIVATPHFMRGRFDVEYPEILERVEDLRNIAKKNNIDINIYAGQEVYYSSYLIEYFNDKCIGTINGSRYMLIELPMLEFNLDEVINTIYELQIRKIVPIIAHPERYNQFIKKPSMINALIKEGMLFQLNAGSITGSFGKAVKKTAQKFLEHNVYSFIGSDAHRDRGRDTDMSEALKLLERSQKRAFISNASAMIDDEEVLFRGTAVKEKKFLGIF
ncbi:CpsB/CapC family capsule biosynthesis tyrosine phosphatase [Clostridium sp. 1001271B_151109_B4]|uniref:tyrosine-protein phosphatase n=1 Tax=Clostridium sp. 1001271B_151109_B4 TaxID=2787148 RepID=UPI0018AA0F66|nr:CpsB/CapC family capsule biosynthesis tyrosine phosphatase [Clostridium sp. 1001271B_151109_B4]